MLMIQSIGAIQMTNSNTTIETDLESIIGTMAIEGIELTDEQIANCRSILNGEVDGEAMVEKLLDKYRVSTEIASNKREAG